MATQDWLHRIDQTTAAFQEFFGRLSAAQLNWKPHPDSWSIAQHIDHLIVINCTYFPVFEAIQNGKNEVPWPGKIGFLVRFFGKQILKSVRPDYPKRIQTFPMWEPETRAIEGNILERFVEHQAILKEWIARLEPYIEKGTVLSSPANKNIVYSLGTAIEIITTHEQRHLEHAKALLAQLPVT